MSPKSSLSSTWSSLASRLRGSKSGTATEPEFPRTESKTEAEWSATIRAETEAARKRAKKIQAKEPLYRRPALERRLVVFYKYPWFGYSAVAGTKRKKRIWYKLNGDAITFSITDLSDYILKARQECFAEAPELLAAIDRWLGIRKNRKDGWQFKCTIADGEKKISNRIPGRFGTFVVYVLIERLVPGQAAGGIAHDQEVVDGVAVAKYQLTATTKGVGTEVLKPVSAKTTIDTNKMEIEKPQHELVDQSACRMCGVSTWNPSKRCDNIHAT